MAENQERRCQECGAVLLPKRRFCVACSAHVSAVGQEQADRLTDILREMPSTHEPDKTIVFVPEYREARLKRERRDKRLMVSALVACLVLLVVSLAVWRLSPRKKSEVPKQQRETMAKRDLDLYAKAFEDFRSDVGRYPTVQEGLGALLKRPVTTNNWHGPYIEADYSVDPWGHDYVYQSVAESKGYIMFTFGPEGESAGRYYMHISSGAPEPDVKPKN